MSKSEKPPLPPSASESPSFYFLPRNQSHLKTSNRDGVTYDAVSSEEGSSSKNTIIGEGVDESNEEVLNVMPAGSSKEDFASRPVLRHLPSGNGEKKGFLSSLFSSAQGKSTPPTQIDNKIIKPRKVPIKIEPKVFFANERTFLAWMHASVLLAGAAIAIIAFADANPWSQMYGVMLLPVAICFIAYAMYQYSWRAYMIRKRMPGPYEDLVGPTVLAVMLMISIVANFAIKLYSVMDE